MNMSFKDIEEFKKHVVEPMLETIRTEVKTIATDAGTTAATVAAKAATEAATAAARAEAAAIARSTAETETAKLAKAINSRVESLEKNQARALVGWTVFVAGVTLLFSQLKAWILSHFRMNQ